MKWLNIITLLLAIIGGVNWGLVAIGGYDMDLVANLSGGADTGLARTIYGLVGLSALWQIVPWATALRMSESRAEAGHARMRTTH
jgi:uncharacterized membrane protein YuzA (DUF378 family)